MENGQSVFFLSLHTPYERVRLARFARVRLLRHALPISLLILRKKPTVLQSTFLLAAHDRFIQVEIFECIVTFYFFCKYLFKLLKHNLSSPLLSFLHP